MARAAWLCSPPLSHALPPCLRCLPAPHLSVHRRICSFTSSGRLLFSFSRWKSPTPAVYAQARRISSTKSKVDQIASSADMQFEAPLKIVEYPNPILRAKNKKINTFDDNLKRLADEMFDVMYRTDGIGLSAPQVGINVQLMVFNAAGERGDGEEIVLVNPRVNRYSRKTVPYNEGCLSFPGIYADVQRPDSVKIDAQDITGERFAFSLSGLPARVFQHEYDHLLGILFFDRMSDEVLDSIRVDLQTLEKKYEESTGLPSPERIENRKTRNVAVGFGKT